MENQEDLNISFHKGDITSKLHKKIQNKRMLAWDIETSGLNWQKDQIGLCQLYAPNLPIIIVKIKDEKPERLRELVGNNNIKKVFHNALFDLRFMSHHWKVTPQNIMCTKVAAKLLNRNERKESKLKYLLRCHLNVDIDKSLQTSDWVTNSLTSSQIQYAARDVKYLFDLLEILKEKLRTRGILGLAQNCFEHIPTRVKLEILGYNDIFSYHSQ